MSFLFPLFLLAVITITTAQCPDCDTVSSLLSSCSLPPLDRDWRTIQSDQGGTVFRNLSGVPYQDPFDAGPDTTQLKDYSEAECLCVEAIDHLNACTYCLDDAQEDNTAPNNARDGSDAYYYDCTQFGYFANDTLAYPSTTLTSVPVQTSISTVPAGCDSCGIIEGQIVECGLLPLDTPSADIPGTSGQTRIYSEADNSSLYAHLLFNRTAAECLCTLPVLRRFGACRYCIQSLEQREVLDYYRFDCMQMGYWTDSEIVESEERPSSSGSSSSSSSSSSPTSGSGSAISTQGSTVNTGVSKMVRYRKEMWFVFGLVVMLLS